MYCAHYHDCNVMKKHCCSFKSDVGVQTDFSDKQHRPRRKITIVDSDRYIRKSEKTKEKNIDKYDNVDSLILFDISIKNYDRFSYIDESVSEARAISDELCRNTFNIL